MSHRILINSYDFIVQQDSSTSTFVCYCLKSVEMNSGAAKIDQSANCACCSDIDKPGFSNVKHVWIVPMPKGPAACTRKEACVSLMALVSTCIL